MTNYEYIRSLTLEEMAEELPRGDWCDSSCTYGLFEDKCRECIRDWLNAEREEFIIGNDKF